MPKLHTVSREPDGPQWPTFQLNSDSRISGNLYHHTLGSPVRILVRSPNNAGLHRCRRRIVTQRHAPTRYWNDWQWTYGESKHWSDSDQPSCFLVQSSDAIFWLTMTTMMTMMMMMMMRKWGSKTGTLFL